MSGKNPDNKSEGKCHGRQRRYAMERRKRIRELVSILMESNIYLYCPLQERYALINRLADRITWCN